MDIILWKNWLTFLIDITMSCQTFFLLATSNSYFVFNATDGMVGLCPADATLEDVYNGMKRLEMG